MQVIWKVRAQAKLQDNESDISVSSANTEDLLDLDFSENEEEGEIRWSCYWTPVNVKPSTVRAGASLKIFFIPNELVGMIVEETNCYARQWIAQKPDPKWQNTSHEEIQAFFGLHMPYDYHILPKTSLYYM